MPQNQPMYRFIADDLRSKIKDGRLAPGEKLSTEGELGIAYEASRNTVREAIRRLTDEGLRESRPGHRYIDGIPWSKQTTFYLMDFVIRGASDLLMAKDIEGGAVQYLADEIGVKQTGYRDWITGRLATDEEQALFGIGHNAAVFVDSRVAFDQNNTPMRLTITIFPVDRNQLIVNVGPNVPPLTSDSIGQ